MGSGEIISSDDTTTSMAKFPEKMRIKNKVILNELENMMKIIPEFSQVTFTTGKLVELIPAKERYQIKTPLQR